MASVKELRAFIQKEIQQKRFLLDMDEMLGIVDGLEGLEKEKKASIDGMTANAKVLQDKADSMQAVIDGANTKAAEVVKDASAQAEKAIADAKAKAKDIVAAADADAQKILDGIETLRGEQRDLQAAVNALKTEKTAHQSDIDALEKVKDHARKALGV